MKITAIILTFIAAVFTAVTAFQVGTPINAPAAGDFGAVNLSSLFFSLPPLWLPTEAIDVAGFTIWPLIPAWRTTRKKNKAMRCCFL